MGIKRFLCITLSAFILMSCSKPDLEFVNTKDDVAQIERYFLKGNLIRESPENSDSKWVAIDLMAEKQKHGDFKYFIVAKNAADGNKTIWINHGDSLIFNLDGTPYTFKTEDSPNHYTSPMYWYTEIAGYPVSREFLNTLINSKNTKFRIYGERGNVAGEFGLDQKNKFKQFLEHL